MSGVISCSPLYTLVSRALVESEGGYGSELRRFGVGWAMCQSKLTRDCFRMVWQRPKYAAVVRN